MRSERLLALRDPIHSNRSPSQILLVNFYSELLAKLKHVPDLIRQTQIKVLSLGFLGHVALQSLIRFQLLLN